MSETTKSMEGMVIMIFGLIFLGLIIFFCWLTFKIDRQRVCKDKLRLTSSLMSDYVRYLEVAFLKPDCLDGKQIQSFKEYVATIEDLSKNVKF